MSPLVMFVLAGAGTYFIRLSAVAIAGHTGPPSDEVRATLRLIAPAVLAAIVAAQLFVVDGAVAVRWEWWMAGAIAAGVAVRWKSPGLTVAAGMVAVWVIGAFT